MEFKVCTKCNNEQPVTEYSWKNKAAGIHQHICKKCARATSKQNYENNKKRHVQVVRAATKIRVQKHKEYVLGLGLSCIKCGEDHPAVLDFHHTDPSTKESEVSDLVGNGSSMVKIKQEIDKCIVLCSNCHRKLHWKERNA